MKIRLINRRPATSETYEALADNIFADVCEDIQIQSPMTNRPLQSVASVVRPSAFAQVRRIRSV